MAKVTYERSNKQIAAPLLGGEAPRSSLEKPWNSKAKIQLGSCSNFWLCPIIIYVIIIYKYGPVLLMCPQHLDFIACRKSERLTVKKKNNDNN